MSQHTDYCTFHQFAGRGGCICKPNIAQDIDPRDCWETPTDLFNALDREFRFTWDLAADKHNAKCWQFIDAAQDALSVYWRDLGGWLFVNPPFSNLERFMWKTALECINGTDVVAVFPSNRFDRAWMHEHVIGKAKELRVSKGRPNYDPPPGVDRTHPEFGTCVAIFDHLMFSKLGPKPKAETRITTLVY